MSRDEVDVMPTAELLDAYQIAEQLGVHVVTVRKWMTTGELRAAKFGKRRLVRPADLVAFIDARVEQPT